MDTIDSATPMAATTIQRPDTEAVSPPTRAKYKTSNGFWQALGPPLLSAVIGGCILIAVNAWAVPMITRHQKRVDRMYQAMFDADESARLLDDCAWNVWNRHEGRGQDTEGAFKEWRPLQAKAENLTNHLALTFNDSIATEWQSLVEKYVNLVRPIAHPEEIGSIPTRQKMDENTNLLRQSAGNLVRKMQQAIRKTESHLL